MFLPRRRRQTPPPGSGLHQCPVCRAGFVVPVWWEERDDKRLRLLLRCGECETHHDIEVAGDVADRFEQEYVRDLEAMAATVDALDRKRMAAEASAFSAALARDLIVADDFRF
jgi:hypothetical protein